MIPKNFTVAEIDELIEAKNKIFTGPYPKKIYSKLIQELSKKTQWLNGSEITEDLLKITNSKNLTEVDKILTGWKQEVEEKPVESTRPQKEQLEVLEKGLEERKEQSLESKKAVQEDIETLKQRAEKIYLQSKTEVPEVSLDGNDRVVLENLAKSASSDPETFVNDLSQTINQKTGVDIESSQIAALDLYERIATQTQSTPPEVFLTTASHFDSEEIQEASLVFGKLAEENSNQLREIFTPILGKNLSETFYPSNPREFEATNERTDKTLFEIDPEQLVKDYKEVNPFNVLGKIKEAGRDHVKNIILQKIEALPAQSAIRGIFSKAQSSMFFRRALPFLGLSAPAEVVATSFVGKSIQFLFPKFAPIIADFGTKLGINIGIKTIAPVVGKAVGTTAVKTVGKTLGGVAVGILAKVGINIPASFVPGLNIAVWAITILSLLKDLGKLIKELGPKIKKWLSDNAPALIGIGALGLLLRNPLIAGLGLVSIFAGLLSGASLARLGARTAFFFGRIGSSLAITIATPVIVAIVVFPILVAVILFIINSGAYVVPPQSVGMPGECNSEIQTKPDPTGTLFSNDGKYAYPLSPANSVGESCTHWDKSLATDIFPSSKHVPVIAYTGGYIEGISTNDSKGGKYVILAGNDGRFYYYAHNCALFVEEGQSVSTGEVIATSDQSGSARDTPEHLHFAISKYPNFVGGGTICPSEDFADKFSSYNRCAPEKRCIP